jgi:5-methyltetrahydropteroyltriglutamate--homocysteine methyltransferase
MLRPSYLLEARTQVEAERLSDVAFKQVEDRAVDGCIAVQERAGADVVADGEMRRNVFASQLVQSTEGFESIQNNSVGWFDMDGNIQTSPVTVGVTCRIKRKRHLSAEEFSYLRAKTPLATKVPIPSPTMYAYYWIPGVSDAAYDSNDAYLADVVDILRDEVDALVRLGAAYIQIDAPEFGMLLDSHQRAWFAAKGFDPDRLVETGVEMINTVMGRHSGVTRRAQGASGHRLCRSSVTMTQQR